MLYPIAACSILALLVACSSQHSMSKPVSKSSFVSLSSAPSQDSSAKAKRTVDIKSEAAALSSSAGRVALALVIYKLDNSKAVDELAKKDAATLFDILQEVALQKSQSLESLDDQYDLHDILASENIHVTIKANNVTSASQTGSNTDWVTNFQNVINSN